MLIVLCAVIGIHARWILVHFSSGGYLLDSGWFAHLFESRDPLLRNPSSVSGLSYYAHHISPFLYLLGAPLSILGLDGIRIFAIHQGLFFGIFFIACMLIVAKASTSFPRRLALLSGAAAIGALSQILLQAAAYPHFEIALLALSSLAVASYIGGYHRLFLGSLLLLPLIREDGGFYGALACFSCIVVNNGLLPRIDKDTLLLGTLGAAGVAASIASLFLQKTFFPGYAAFAANFSGNSWDHVSLALLVERALWVASQPSFSIILIGSLLLAIRDRRYLAGLLLLSPLLLAHLLAVRDELGRFTLYYALPWMFVCIIWLAVLVQRMHEAGAGREIAAIAALALLLASPVQNALGVSGHSWDVAVSAFKAPVADIQKMKKGVLSRMADGRPEGAKRCVSLGIAALIPDRIGPDAVLDPKSDLARCEDIFLMHRDMHYAILRPRVEAEGFVRAAVIENGEHWMRRWKAVEMGEAQGKGQASRQH